MIIYTVCMNIYIYKTYIDMESVYIYIYMIIYVCISN